MHVPERQGRDVEQEQVLGLLGRVAGEDGGLDGGAVRDGLVGVDRLVGLLAVEEVGDELDDTGDTSGATDKDNFVDIRLVDLGVTEDTLDGLEGAAEEVLAELFETGTSERSVEIDTLEQRVDFNGGLSGGGQGSLGTFASSSETTNGTGVSREI